MTINKDEAIKLLRGHLTDFTSLIDYQFTGSKEAMSFLADCDKKAYEALAATSHITPDAADPPGTSICGMCEGTGAIYECIICGSAEPRTGTCGSDDPRALCNFTSPAIAPEASELPPIPHHPEMTFAWTVLERDAIKKYGEECARATIAMHQSVSNRGEAASSVTLDEALYALDLVLNKMHVPGLSGQRAFATDVLKRAAAEPVPTALTCENCGNTMAAHDRLAQCPASEAVGLYEIQRNAAEQAVCANLVRLGLIDPDPLAAPAAPTDAGVRDKELHSLMLGQAVAFHNFTWPDQLSSGVMFFNGQRITVEEFGERVEAFRKACKSSPQAPKQEGSGDQ